MSLLALGLLGALQDGDLFNGRDLAGFKTVHGAPDTFTMQGGELVCSGKPAGYLASEKRYRNFTLRYEWKFLAPGNNGCLLFIAEPDALDIWPRSIEVQGMHAQAGLILPIPRHLGVTHTDHPAARRSALKPPEEWNAFEIVVVDGGGVILLNGRRVSEFRGSELKEGPIGFQSEGAPIRFRNVKIREEDGTRGLAFSPQLSEEAGVVVIDTFGATVRFTRDGREPTRASPVYVAPFRSEPGDQVVAAVLPEDNPGLRAAGTAMAGRSVTGARPGWKVLFADSQETSGENAPAVNAIDGDPDTFWHTRWADENPPHPHEIRIDMGAEKEIAEVGILPRSGDQANGTIDGYELYLSNDPRKWGEPAAKGKFGKAGGERRVKLTAKAKARYLRLVALSEINGNLWTSVAEIATYP